MPAALEHPPLGKTFIMGFDSGDTTRPILAVAKDPRKPYTLPAAGSTTGLSSEAITLWSDNKFTGVQHIDETRMLWIYEILPGVILTEYDQDEETLSLITTTYQIVANPVVAPTAVQGQVTAIKRVDKTKSLKIVRTIEKPADYDEQRLMAYTFPSLFDYTVYIYTDDCGAFSNIRAGFSTLVLSTVSVSFTNTKQTISGLSLIPKTLQLGKGVQIHEAVLVDAGTYTYTGACTATVAWDASDPDYSTYIGAIKGTDQTISGESVFWKAGYYRTTTIKIKMR